MKKKITKKQVRDTLNDGHYYQALVTADNLVSIAHILLKHEPAIQKNKKFKKSADKIEAALADLYVEIGAHPKTFK